jgi:uncharacterized protein
MSERSGDSRRIVPSGARLRALVRAAALLLGAALASGCASYPDRTAKALGEFQSGRFEGALAAFEDPKTTGSPFLAGVEAGTVALAAGDWDRALANLGRASACVEETERRALISPESLGEALMGWALDPGASDYEGEGYERVLLHAQLGLAYLAKGDLEGAQVEVRRANELLESEEKLYEKEYRAGGLGHFLSAITYELDGKPDDAYIDYARMQAKGIGGELVGRALVRLARRLRFEDDLARWTELYGAEDERPADAVNVVVIAGLGLGPYKREIALTIPTPDGILQWAVPDYASRPQRVGGLEVSVAGGEGAVRTVVVEDVTRVARENLEDRVAWLAARSAVRSVLKRELTKELTDEAGIWGRIAGDVFAFVTERADLRAWQTLPDTWQAARVFLPPGIHAIRIAAEGGEACVLDPRELTPGETLFVFVRTIEDRLYVHPVGGRKVDPATPTSPSP